MAGVMKRWNFSGGPRTHGQSDRGRAPGSIGQGTTPGRVYKGKHMAARMGGNNVTTKNCYCYCFRSIHRDSYCDWSSPQVTLVQSFRLA
jgi:ribosomal protein L3